MQSVGEARRFWWRGTSPLTTPPLALSVDPDDRTLAVPCDLRAADRLRTRSRFDSHVVKRRSGRSAWLGAPLLMIVTGVVVFAVASLGGTRLAPHGSIVLQLDRLAAEAGLAIRDITISGHDGTREREVYAAIDGLRARSLVGFDTRAARIAVERLPWVAAASVTRAWPDRIVVGIRPRRPAAIWREGAREHLVDATGHVISVVAPGVAAGLPILVGPGAAAATDELLGLLAARPELVARMAYAERVGGRRWTLVTHSGQRVHLPAGHPAQIAAALDRLMAGRDGERLIDRAFATLDLRSADRVVLSSSGSGARL